MRRCHHSGPCGCAMGQLSRLIEPVLLFLLARKGHSYGYDLAAELPAYALGPEPVDRTTLYRCLRQLETHGHLVSHWDLPTAGPARRVYCVTASGRQHLQEWMCALELFSGTLDRLLREARTLESPVEESLTT
jgi:PadR family transcriptional regulator, regulatory protein PadR